MAAMPSLNRCARQPEQILNARADDDLLRRAFHTAVHPTNIRAICAAQRRRRPASRRAVKARAAGRAAPSGCAPSCAPGTAPCPRCRWTGHSSAACAARSGRRRCRGGGGAAGAAVQHAVGLLHVKAAAGARLGQTLGGQHLVGGVHRVDADALLRGHGAAARQRRAGGALAGADLIRQGGVQLLIQRRFLVGRPVRS